MNTSTATQPLPTQAQLFKATGIAMLVAGLILITTVLPAEYGLDPTGIGRRLGIYGMSTAATPPKPAEAVPAEANVASAPASAIASPVGSALHNEYVLQSLTAFQSQEMSVTLAPNEGAEIKARMLKGAQFTFAWDAGGTPVHFDMHGEKLNAAKDEFTSFWLADLAQAAGTFTAPFDGVHGWYWQNNSSAPVTVKVTVSGFYSELYRP